MGKLSPDLRNLSETRHLFAANEDWAPEASRGAGDAGGCAVLFFDAQLQPASANPKPHQM